MENYILLQIHDYDYHENFTSLKSLMEKYPTPVSFTLIKPDGTEKDYLIKDLVEAGVVKENSFDETYLKEYARVKRKEQNPPQLWSFGVFEQEINGKLSTCTGSYPERPATEEEIIKSYKEANKYQWI